MTMRALTGANHSVAVVNCFTVSEYAPYGAVSGMTEVGRLRSEEDRQFASGLGNGIEVVDLGLLDAPIRLRCPVSAVRPRAVSKRDRDDVYHVADRLARFADGVLLAPLGLGAHIDHLVAREVAIRMAQSGKAVGFYEDLPYAAESRECCILRAVDVVSRRIGHRLRAGLVSDSEGLPGKRTAIEAYASQLSSAQVGSVIDYAQTLGGCERLWMPAGALAAFPIAMQSAEIRSSGGAPVLQRMRCAKHVTIDLARRGLRRLTELNSRGETFHVPESHS